MKYIKRDLENIVLKLTKQFPAVLITGPRQVGKTTMLKKLIENENRGRKYVTLDDFEERDLAKKDPALFFQLHQPPVLIDEIQYAPELFPYIKIIADRDNIPGEFWLTGSQIFKLMRGVQESLAGRVALLSMLPFSQSEIAGVKNEPFTVDFEKLLERQKKYSAASTPEIFERIWKGGMPAIVSGNVSERTVFYSAYLSTYIERDVRQLSGVIDTLKFMKFITAVAARDGQLLNSKNIADDADINQATAKNWLNIMETLGIIFYLFPYSNNVLKRTIKTPKMYFYDTGLVCYLTKWSSPEIAMNGAMSGALFENYTIAEIVKSYYNNAKEPNIYYYRDRDTKEIDLLLEGDGQLNPIEIKKSALPEKRMTQSFSVIEKSPLKRGTGAIICMAENLNAFDRENLIIPAWML
ncbi:MAG: ATP-binding protein [Clostridia bacterium]|jgi:hypothetical protein